MSESYQSGEIRAVTLGAWLERVAADGWGDDRVWLALQDAAEAALPSIRRRLRPGEELADDLVSEALLVAQRSWERWRRSEIAEVGLARWMWGVLRNLLRAMRRRVLRTAGGRAEESSVRDDDETERLGEAELRRLDAARFLTRNQLAAWELHCRGLTHAEAAAEIGISRDAFRDRLRRAKQRLRAGLPAPTAHDPQETAALANAVATAGNTTSAALLRTRALGRSYRECAEALGLTLDAVRSRIARAFRGPSAPGASESTEPTPVDTGLPSATLLTEEGAPALPEGGARDGNPPDPVARRGPLHPPAHQRGRDPP